MRLVLLLEVDSAMLAYSAQNRLELNLGLGFLCLNYLRLDSRFFYDCFCLSCNGSAVLREISSRNIVILTFAGSLQRMEPIRHMRPFPSLPPLPLFPPGRRMLLDRLVLIRLRMSPLRLNREREGFPLHVVVPHEDAVLGQLVEGLNTWWMSYRRKIDSVAIC